MLYTLCHQPSVNFTSDFHGRVVGCCRDLRREHVLGNLLEQSTDAICDRMVNPRESADREAATRHRHLQGL
jgi:Iron-sulfur cluster-binding domain